MIAIDLSKQQAPDTDLKAIQQINFKLEINWKSKPQRRCNNVFYY